MNKIQIISLGILSLIIFGGILILLQNLNIGGANSVSIKKAEPVYAGLGETCSTPTFRIGCQSELICADKNKNSDFNPNIETAKCIKKSEVVDLNKTFFEWKKS